MTPIKQPHDFDELLNLNDLMINYRIYRNLDNNLSKYVDAYFQSFFKTKDEVLAYIPEHQYHLYRTYKPVMWPYRYDELEFGEYLDKLLVSYPYKNSTHFIVDTKNKKIVPVLQSDTTYVISDETDEVRVTREVWEKRRAPDKNGYVTRIYVFDTKKNLVKYITGSYM